MQGREKNCDYVDFFHYVTGFKPYDFQINIANKILNDKNVVMQAPTGAGKTWASIIPFLYARYKNMTFPYKLIYSLPLRVLANSLYDEVSKKVAELNSKLFSQEIKVTIQTGEKKQDPYFLEGDIIFTTIDQSISSLLSIALSLPIKQGNINPGAIFSSYLVFDEFHLLETKRALSTIYNILKKVKDITPFCLMTATLSDRLLEHYCKYLNAEKVEVDQKHIYNIGSQKNKIRKVHVVQSPIDVENIISHHKNRTIVICNTVESCKNVYLAIKNKIDQIPSFKDTKLICIHSQFYWHDRKIKEERIKDYFKKDSTANAILVATQVVEVGIDISCEVMHTEISPINSFLQRIGRCARYEGEEGLIFVYDVFTSKENGELKNRPYLPYDEDLCKLTMRELDNPELRKNLDYFRSRELVNNILTEREEKDFAFLQQKERFDEIINCWLNPDRSYASKLIRKIDSVNVIICNNTNNIVDPYEYDHISINRFSLINKLKLIEKEYEDDWLVKIVCESSFDDDFFGKYSYVEVCVDDSRLMYENILLLNLKYVSYNEEIGLNFDGIGNKESLLLHGEKKIEGNLNYIKDSYAEHVELLIKAYNDLFKNKMSYIFRKMKKKYNIKFDIGQVIKLMLIIHDYGKLNIKWQDSVKKYQITKGNYIQGEILAHTDFNYETDYDARPSLPSHSGAGAILGYSIAENLENCESLSKVILNSIVKHHSVHSFSSGKYITIKRGKELVLNLLKKHCPDLFEQIDINNEIFDGWNHDEKFEDVISYSKLDRNYEALLYFLFVRILRICDQKSFEYKGERG